LGPTLGEEELEPTEMISPEVRAEVIAEEEAEPPAPDDQPPAETIEDAVEELKQVEMAAFIMVGVLVLVGIIFLVVRHG
jgi:hypothetical protein